MKIFIFTLCCIMLTLPTTSIGGTIKDVFGKVKTGVQKVEEDVKAFFHLNKNSDNQEGAIVFRDEDEVSSFTTKPEEITTKVAVPEITTTTLSTTTIESASKGNGTTGKDGRENFTGGCSTGYLRTPDGRCKPTF